MWKSRILSVVIAMSFALIGTQAMARQWGAKLTKHDQPSNAGNGVFCEAGSETKPVCTWVLRQARNCEFGNCTNGHLAPKDGTIKHIRLVTCAKGSFTLQVARANSTGKKFMVVHTGPHIAYQADSQGCEGDTFDVQEFPVNVQVKKGDYLAVEAKKVGFMYCSGGSNNTLEFEPPLPDNGPFTKNNGQTGCFLLLEGTYD